MSFSSCAATAAFTFGCTCPVLSTEMPLAKIDVALAFHIPQLRVRGAVRVDGQRVGDAARNGGHAAGVQIGV